MRCNGLSPMTGEKVYAVVSMIAEVVCGVSSVLVYNMVRIKHI